MLGLLERMEYIVEINWNDKPLTRIRFFASYDLMKKENDIRFCWQYICQ